jgi:hypothetical protein
MSNHARLSALLIGVCGGAAIWLLSPVITGRREPWDADGGYYAAALLGAGLIGGLLVPRRWVAVAVGILVGQVLIFFAGVFREPGDGGLWPLGLLFLVACSILGLVGAGTGAAGRRLVDRLRKRAAQTQPNGFDRP